MQTLDPDTMNLLAAVLVIALIAVVGWIAYERYRSHGLQQHFGNEYQRTLDRLGGDRRKAEAELHARRKRVEKLTIVPLSAADARRFADRWKALQARFVDDPKGVVGEADRLVRELMLQRGYPMADFEHRAADISVDHPKLVDNYRAAHDIAMRAPDGKADTEAIRKAVVHYRALFDELLEATPDTPSGEMRTALH